MPAHTSWTMFNKSFHEWFIKDVPAEMEKSKKEFFHSLSRFKPLGAKQALGVALRIRLWNYVHRIQDGIWDPRGKRALFEGLDVQAPRILFLGAAEGYEAMQLSAMYPGGEIVMVDYDPFCKEPASQNSLILTLFLVKVSGQGENGYIINGILILNILFKIFAPSHLGRNLMLACSSIFQMN
ncbi:hypothetical protein GCM10009865_26110 [Aeromicrobium ponti]|uniref:Uncharacterized protein n=1 Tax=Cytobacillus oceanisediminis TaxID=665099 RepID=A0A562JTL2_9BACI|nr:hypothetical protein [Cytobacillus oceanisediminis]TWH86506.1 hypothetical protein IQ19_02528 [Cytobacillus oceanisediminis]